MKNNDIYNEIKARMSIASYSGDKRQAESAVRLINTVDVAIHDSPESLGLDAIKLPTIRVHKGLVDKWMKLAETRNIKVFYVDFDNEDAQDFIRIANRENVRTGATFIFPQSLLSYTKEYGLRLGESDCNFDVKIKESHLNGLHRKDLKHETWLEHSLAVVEEANVLLQQNNYVLNKIASALNVSVGILTKAVRTAALFHDLGKLNEDWQLNAGISKDAEGHELIAHTGFEVTKPFPPHATVSAYALHDALLLSNLFPKPLAKAILFAIAHHHSTGAHNVPSFTLHKNWRAAVREAINNVPGLNGLLNLERVITSQKSSTKLPLSFPDILSNVYPFYIFISRFLRLADMLATGGEDAVIHYEDYRRLIVYSE